MPDEIAPDFFRLPIPLPDNPLGRVNVYAVRTDDGIRLVDCGWDTPEAYAALNDELEAIGGGIQALREILVTHIHPDHFGLAQRLVTESGARLSMHRLDAVYVGARYEDVRDLTEQMSAWLRINGVPAQELGAMTAGSLQMLRRVGTRRPDVLLEGGERLEWGAYRFQVLWTPGHSNGLVCLWDSNQEILLSTDHVLERISPHVGLHTQSLGNPLADYLDSLAAVRDLPARIILPGHGEPFSGLANRVDALTRHHEERLATMITILTSANGPALPRAAMTAYNIASCLPWKRDMAGWERLAAFERRMALTEVVAHLEYLAIARRIAKHHREGVVHYMAVPNDNL